MKISIDPDVCTGHGRCYVFAPEVVEPDDAGHGTVVLPDVPPEHQDAARRAAENCPEGAVTIVE
jgi:ferredoxin